MACIYGSDKVRSGSRVQGTGTPGLSEELFQGKELVSSVLGKETVSQRTGLLEPHRTMTSLELVGMGSLLWRNKKRLMDGKIRLIITDGKMCF